MNSTDDITSQRDSDLGQVGLQRRQICPQICILQHGPLQMVVGPQRWELVIPSLPLA